MQKRTADEIVRKTLASMGNTSSDESDNESKMEDQYMMVVDDSNSDNKNILALMENSDSEVEDGQGELSFLDVMERFILTPKRNWFLYLRS